MQNWKKPLIGWTQCISVWYSNATNQDCKVLQRVVRLAERISASELLKSSKTQITPITVSSFYCHLASASGAWWQKLRDWGGASSKLKLSLITFTRLNLMCTYPVQPCLHIPLAHPCLYYNLLSPQYTVLHILPLICILLLPIFIYILV